jgi:hypothetical protein
VLLSLGMSTKRMLTSAPGTGVAGLTTSTTGAEEVSSE